MNERRAVIVKPGDASAGPAPPRSRHGATLLGLSALVIAAGGLGGWGALVPLSGAVVSQGEIVVATKRKQVQHVVGGTVKAIHVRDGSKVRAGELLVELDAEKAERQFALSRGAYLAALAAHSRALAERDGRTTLAFPAELRLARDAKGDVARLLVTQERLFETRRGEYLGQRRLLVSRVAQLRDEVTGLAAEEAANAIQLELARKELATLRMLFEKGHTTRHRVLAFEREQARLDGSGGRLAARIARARKEAGATEMEILQLGKQRDREIAVELRDLAQQMLEHRERYLAAEAELARLRVLAPVAGTVVGLLLHTVGGVVSPGETMLEIVPEDDALIIETRVRPVDIDNVAVGQATSMRLTAYGQRALPVLSGRVVYVAADRSEDSRTGEVYYTARIAIDAGALDGLDGAPLTPGMPAEVYIRTGERTALAYLAQPIVDSVSRAWRED
jgi:HlyD family type I secretion membrane fusion protein